MLTTFFASNVYSRQLVQYPHEKENTSIWKNMQIGLETMICNVTLKAVVPLR